MAYEAHQLVCITPADTVMLREDLERQNPGSTANPFQDSRFHALARFDEGSLYELDVFEFDLR